MAEVLRDSESGTLESATIGIYRTAATVKGGRRFSFGALVAVGDRSGSVGLGYGKAPSVPAAIEKAQKEARKKMRPVVLNRDTIPHEVTGGFLSSKVRLIPASPGTGVIAGSTVRQVLELAGVKDVLTKSYGSNNQKNLAKAVFDGLEQLHSRETIASLRGVTIEKTVVDDKIELGERFAPAATSDEDSPKAKAPVNTVGQDRKGGRGRGGGGRGRGGGGRGRGGAPQPPAPATTTTAEAPAPPAEAPATEAPAESSDS